MPTCSMRRIAARRRIHQHVLDLQQHAIRPALCLATAKQQKAAAACAQCVLQLDCSSCGAPAAAGRAARRQRLRQQARPTTAAALCRAGCSRPLPTWRSARRRRPLRCAQACVCLCVRRHRSRANRLPCPRTAPSQLLEPLTGKTISLTQVSSGAKATLVMFICNHCPFVVMLKSEARSTQGSLLAAAACVQPALPARAPRLHAALSRAPAAALCRRRLARLLSCDC